MKYCTFGFACVLATMACSSICGRAQESRPQSSLGPSKATNRSAQVEVITLVRFGHRIGAPFYRVVLKQDGTVVYTGELNVARIGRYETKISRLDFGRLKEMVEKFHYFEMINKFFTDDTDHVKISVSKGSEVKTLQHAWSSDVPIELWAIEVAIDGVLANITEWKKIN